MRNIQRIGLATLASVLILSSVGCERITVGEKGAMTFALSKCGPYAGACKNTKLLAVGGTLSVFIKQKQFNPSLEVTVSDPDILAIIPTPGKSSGHYTVTALNPGSAEVRAFNTDGELLDKLTFRTQAVERLTLAGFDDHPDTIESESDSVKIWSLPANKTVIFWVIPDFGDHPIGMGKYNYRLVDIEPPLAEAIHGNKHDLDEIVKGGLIALKVPEGKHALTLETTDGAFSLTIVFVGEPLF